MNSRRYLRRLCESWARISRSTPASACSCRCAAAGPQIGRDAISPLQLSSPLLFDSLLSVLTSRLTTPYAPSVRERRLASPEALSPNHPPQNLTIATTGASGSIFLRHFLLAVERDARIQT